MKAQITIIDEKGVTFEGEVELSRVGSQRHITRKEKGTTTAAQTSLDFDTPIRAFTKKNARGLSGAKKFTLLLSRLTKGDLTKKVELKEIKKHWNKMTSLLGGEFNGAHSNRAIENGWVDSPKQGQYMLSRSW